PDDALLLLPQPPALELPANQPTLPPDAGRRPLYLRGAAHELRRPQLLRGNADQEVGGAPSGPPLRGLPGTPRSRAGRPQEVVAEPTGDRGRRPRARAARARQYELQQALESGRCQGREPPGPDRARPDPAGEIDDRPLLSADAVRRRRHRVASLARRCG